MTNSRTAGYLYLIRGLILPVFASLTIVCLYPLSQNARSALGPEKLGCVLPFHSYYWLTLSYSTGTSSGFGERSPAVNSSRHTWRISCAHLGKEKRLLLVKVHLTSRGVFPPFHIISHWQVSQNPYELWLCSHQSPKFQTATPWTPRWPCFFTWTTRTPRKAPSPPALRTQVGRTLHSRFFTHKINTPISCPVYPHEAEETRKCWEVFGSWRLKMPWK